MTTGALFLVFVAALAVFCATTVARYLGGKSGGLFAAGLLVWLAYVGGVSYVGVIRNVAMRPPGPAFLFVPVTVLLATFVRWTVSPAGGRAANGFPLRLLLGAQVFRVGVELFIHQLWREGFVPQMLTFAGANVDIYIGASAPVIAWLSTRYNARRVALVWNVLGLLALANVVIRAITTAPGPLNFLHAETPNLMIGTFPYTFIPGFFVPLAVALHALSIRALTSRAAR